MIGGFVFSLIVFAVGAVLDFAVTTDPYQHGMDIQTVGLILMIVAAIGAVLSLAAMVFGRRRRKLVVQDSSGNVLRKEQESYL
ncbi:MAG: hypothetical protein ACRDWE_01730 [Acidimicrobiales bacterium]